jgi:superfamily I DNA/RNA helicase
VNAEWWVNIKQLDHDQKEVMGLPADRDLLVLGPPGSGKTNILLLRASYLSKAGFPNLLVVVFGRPLREFLARGSSQYRFDSQKITTSTKWLFDVLKELGEPRPESTLPFEQVRSELIERVRAAIANRSGRPLYDVVLIDEAQDFLPDEIALFSQLAKRIFAVGDANQKIYSGPTGLDALRARCDIRFLRYHYRNGIKICRFADAIATGFPDHQPLSQHSNYSEATARSSVHMYNCANVAEQARIIASELAKQLKTYPRELLGVLCPRRADVDEVAKLLAETEIAEHLVKQTFEDGYSAFNPDARVCISTIHGSKGLEFRTVHAPCLEQIRRFPRQRNLAYTLATRAKTSLSLYASGSLPGFIESSMAAVNPPASLPPLDVAFGEDV